MDNKELSLEEIIAKENAEKESSDKQTASVEKNMKLEDLIENKEKDTVSDEADVHNELAAEKLLGGAVITAEDDEIVPEDEPLQESDETELPEEDDDILSEEVSETEDADEASDDEYDDTDEEQDDDVIYDEDDEELDNAPTMVMPKSSARRSRTSYSRRRRPAKRKKAKVKQSRFNGTIFGGIILTCIILTVSIVLAVTAISVATEYYGIGKPDNDVIFNIPEGSTNENVADLLYENGIINNKTLFLLALKIEKPETIFPGDITLQPSMGYADVIEKLSTMRKKLKTVNVTITEGMNLLDVANLLEKNKVCKADDFLFEFNKDQGFDFEKDLGVSKDAFYKMEGYFFPDTYNFYVDDTAYNVTKIVREHFQNELNADIMRQIRENKLSLNQIITLASIVQMEAGKESEMPMVASVFVNRMNDPATYPSLQSDTTTRYIDKVIKTKAIDQTSVDFYTSVYDTYTCKGLPASPICNPGLAAIKAVLNPAKSDYYYFCNNLSTGETFFAKTLDEHNANLKKAGLA
ncbi:MAG: endolytic transglycosylase MltG [Ruminococcus sp.]|nr:endolytic transglycosylase MltG [Ruminococcus sp.]